MKKEQLYGEGMTGADEELETGSTHGIDKVKIDKEDMYSLLEDFPKHCKEALELGKNIKIEGKIIKTDKRFLGCSETGTVSDINKVVVVGMGGSGFSGDLLKTYLRDCAVPIFVVKDYMLPEFVDRDALIFFVSYSGNTEEVIAAYRSAMRKNLRAVAITSGGKLDELAGIHKTPVVKVPSGLPPRIAIPYLFFPMLNILCASGITGDKKHDAAKMIEVLKKPAYRSMAEEIAQKLYKKIPIIYSSEQLSAVATKWKTDINENAKVHAFCNVYPGFNHNEINGYVNKVGEFYVIILKDDEDYKRIRERMEITKNLIKNRQVSVTEVVIRGDNFMTKLFSALYIGAWVSYFLALEYKTDPTPVKIIGDLKKELAK